MSKLRVAGSKSRCQQGEPQGAGVPPSGGCGTPGPVAASPQALPPRWHGPLVCRLCVWNLSLPFFIRTLLVDHPGFIHSPSVWRPQFEIRVGVVRGWRRAGSSRLFPPLPASVAGVLGARGLSLCP